MITCPKCGKDNQDHYKFCLGCGAELPREVAPKPFAPQTPPHGFRPQGAPRAEPVVAPPPVVMAPPPVSSVIPGVQGMGAAPASVAAGGSVVCPQCGHVNVTGNLFCGSCGFRLGHPPASSAQKAAPAVPLGAEPAGGGNVVLTALRADGTEAGQYRLPPGRSSSAARRAASSPATATSPLATRPSASPAVGSS